MQLYPICPMMSTLQKTKKNHALSPEVLMHILMPISLTVSLLRLLSVRSMHTNSKQKRFQHIFTFG